MQKKLNLVVLSLKMIFLGYIIDGLNHIMWKSAVGKKRKNYRLLSFTDNAIWRLRDEFGRAETLFLLSYEPTAVTKMIKD